MEIKNFSAAARFRDEKLSKVNLFETPRFFCDLYCIQPGQSQKVHTHAENDKIYAVLRGQATVTIGDETAELGEGDVVLAKAGEPHGIDNTSSDETVCMVFMAPHP